METGTDERGERLAELTAKNETLARENAELRAFKASVEADRATLRAGVGWSAKFAGRVLVGRDLAASIEAWRQAKTAADPLPSPATSNLVAAVIHRLTRIGAFAALLAILPTDKAMGLTQAQLDSACGKPKTWPDRLTPRNRECSSAPLTPGE